MVYTFSAFGSGLLFVLAIAVVMILLAVWSVIRKIEKRRFRKKYHLDYIEERIEEYDELISGWNRAYFDACDREFQERNGKK